MTLDTVQVRSHFPALTSKAVFFDNPGGTQVPHQVIDRMVDYLVTKNANHDGAFATSRASSTCGEAPGPRPIPQRRPAKEIVFGPT